MHRTNPIVLVFRGHQLLVDAAGRPPAAALAGPLADTVLRKLDFAAGDGRRCMTVEVGRDTEPPPPLAFQHLKSLLDSLSATTLALAARALELLEFDRAHRFCGACGAPTTLRTDPPARRCNEIGRAHV